MIYGSTIPNLLTQLGDMTDEYKRNTETWKEEFIRRTVVARKELAPKFDYAGNPIREIRYGTALPLQAAPVKKDELARWLLLNEVPFKPRPRELKELPADIKQELLQDRADTMLDIIDFYGMDKKEAAPAGETKAERAKRLLRMIEARLEAQEAAKRAKSRWAKRAKPLIEEFAPETKLEERIRALEDQIIPEIPEED